jgi:hypothetical protein
MRKDIFLITLLISLTYYVNGQSYRLTTNTVSYIQLSSGNLISQGILWSNYEYTIPLGFSFHITGSILDSLALSDIGAIRFNTLSTSNSFFYLFFGFGVSMLPRSSDTNKTQISYKTEGNSGNRIFKLEYRNCGFSDGGYVNDTINFQIWLYESDYSMEVHIGPINVTKPEKEYIEGNGPVIGLMNENDKNEENTTYSFMLAGSAANPSTTNKSDIYNLPYLSSTPAEGTVYRFIPIN